MGTSTVHETICSHPSCWRRENVADLKQGEDRTVNIAAMNMAAIFYFQDFLI
jgi:hypothetical protein